VAGGRALALTTRGRGWSENPGFVEVTRVNQPYNPLDMVGIPVDLGSDDFDVQGRIQIPAAGGDASAFLLDNRAFKLECTRKTAREPRAESHWCTLRIQRRGTRVACVIDGTTSIAGAEGKGNLLSLAPGNGTLRIVELKIRLFGRRDP
jgi:hypothetical protein